MKMDVCVDLSPPMNHSADGCYADRAEVFKMYEELETMRFERDEANAQVDTLRASLESLQEVHDEELNSRSQYAQTLEVKLRESINGEQEKLSTYLQTIDRLEYEVEKFKAEYAKASELCIESQNSINDLQSIHDQEIRLKNGEIDTIEGALVKLNEEMEMEKRRANDDLIEKEKNLRMEFAENTKKLKEKYEEELGRLRQHVESQQATISEIQDYQKDLLEERKTKEKQLLILNQELRDVRNELQEIKINGKMMVNDENSPQKSEGGGDITECLLSASRDREIHELSCSILLENIQDDPQIHDARKRLEEMSGSLLLNGFWETLYFCTERLIAVSSGGWKELMPYCLEFAHENHFDEPLAESIGSCGAYFLRVFGTEDDFLNIVPMSNTTAMLAVSAENPKALFSIYHSKPNKHKGLNNLRLQYIGPERNFYGSKLLKLSRVDVRNASSHQQSRYEDFITGSPLPSPLPYNDGTTNNVLALTYWLDNNSGSHKYQNNYSHSLWNLGFLTWLSGKKNCFQTTNTDTTYADCVEHFNFIPMGKSSTTLGVRLYIIQNTETGKFLKVVRHPKSKATQEKSPSATNYMSSASTQMFSLAKPKLTPHAEQTSTLYDSRVRYMKHLSTPEILALSSTPRLPSPMHRPCTPKREQRAVDTHMMEVSAALGMLTKREGGRYIHLARERGVADTHRYLNRMKTALLARKEEAPTRSSIQGSTRIQVHTGRRKSRSVSLKRSSQDNGTTTVKEDPHLSLPSDTYEIYTASQSPRSVPSPDDEFSEPSPLTTDQSSQSTEACTGSAEAYPVSLVLVDYEDEATVFELFAPRQLLHVEARETVRKILRDKFFSPGWNELKTPTREVATTGLSLDRYLRSQYEQRIHHEYEDWVVLRE